MNNAQWRVSSGGIQVIHGAALGASYSLFISSLVEIGGEKAHAVALVFGLNLFLATGFAASVMAFGELIRMKQFGKSLSPFAVCVGLMFGSYYYGGILDESRIIIFAIFASWLVSTVFHLALYSIAPDIQEET